MKILNVVLLFVGSLLCVSNVVYSKTWAVLYTGIQGYAIGYSFEAGVARLYDTLVKRNIPKENIITITPNYVAYSMFNPFPGVLVHGTADEYVPGKSKNYNEHVELDYNALDLDQQLLYEILAGNKTAVNNLKGSGRVVESGPKDNILVYIATVSFRGYWLFNNKAYMRVDKFMEGFDQLRNEKRFGQMKIIFEADNPGYMFDGYLDTDPQTTIMGYTTATRFSELHACFENPYLHALTGTCSSLAFFDSLDKVLSGKNSDKLSIFDIFEEHRNYTAHIPSMDSPNIYGRLEMASKPISTYYGPKGKMQTGETEQTETMKSTTKQMIANAFKNKMTLKKYILEQIASTEDKHYSKNLVSRIATRIIRKNALTEEAFNQPMFFKLSPEKMNEYDDVVRAVKNNCYDDQDILLMATQPFELLARLVTLSVSFDQIEEAIKSVCTENK